VTSARAVLDVGDLTIDELQTVLDLAQRPPDSLGHPLAGTGVALIFDKPSNRTRQSMEIAVAQLGGHPVYTRGDEIGFDTRESVEDIARIMDGYHAILAARVFAHSIVERLAAASSVPVVNMLSDWSHPLQALADALTMQQCLGDLSGKTVAYVGDYNNVARSLCEISSMLAMHVRLACPPGFDAPETELERFTLLGAASAVQSTRPAEAVAGAHAVHTDTWVSMGQEDEKQQRVRQFEGYTVDEAMMALAEPDAVFMHCLPAYRGLEVASDVIDGPRSVVVQQAHNRLHAARGALAHLFGVRPGGDDGRAR
jgi:ornithine carbamoyltransferase